MLHNDLERRPARSQRRGSCTHTGRWGGAFALIGLAGLCPASVGQTSTPYTPASVADAYGNVGPLDLTRRSVGLFQTGVQRQALRGYQDLGRRVNRRGGMQVFAVPGDLRLRRRTRSAELPATRFLSPSRYRGQAAWRQAFRHYGGFERRSEDPRQGEAAAALQRRNALITATGLNAPVYRAMLRDGMAMGLRPVTDRATARRLGTPELPATKPATPAPSVDGWLRRTTHAAALRARAGAWEWFREGQYRRAARTFEGVTLVSPNDTESRIGEVFSLVSVGAVRTAIAVMHELDRRTANPFLLQLNVVDAFGNPAQARRVRTDLQLLAAGGATNADLFGLRALVLWYLGEREEAIRVAASTATDFPGTRYAEWPAKMRTARDGLVEEASHP